MKLKWIVLLMAFINVPFFPNVLNGFAAGFATGIFTSMLINEYYEAKP